MVRVKINQAGLFFTIPKYGSFRSPVTLDISEEFLPYVEALFRKSGITEYIVEKVKKKIPIPHFTSLEKEEKFLTIDISPKSEELGDIKERLSSIEGLLRVVLNRKTITREVREEVEKKLVRKKEEEPEVFIPKIGDSKFELKGESTTTEEIGGIDSQVSSLLKMKKTQ